MSRATTRVILLVDQIADTRSVRSASEVPQHIAVVSGSEVHRIVLTIRGNFPVLQFQGEKGELLRTVRCLWPLRDAVLNRARTRR